MTLKLLRRRFGSNRKGAEPAARLTAGEIRARKAEIEAKYGGWTASHIELCEGVATDAIMTGGGTNVNLWSRFHAFTQIIQALTAQPLSELRILDLAVHEGVSSIELALQGATVVGIEGRETNIEKARFAAEALQLDNVTFFQDDVLNVTRQKYGEFDVVLCAGILYHLNFQEGCALIENLGAMCKRALIVDTHCSQTLREFAEYRGHAYHGHSTIDHFPEQTTTESREKNTFSSLDSDFVFFLTVSSLANLMVRSGFGTIFRSTYPYYEATCDRVVLSGVKVPETRVKVFHNPELALPPVPEKFKMERTMLIPGHEFVDGNPQTRPLLSVSPESGSAAAQIFSVTAARPGGYTKLAWIEMLFAASPDSGEQTNCVLHYDVEGKEFWLRGDDGNFLGPVAPGVYSDLLQNSLCAVSTLDSTVLDAGTRLTVNASLTFKAAGVRNIYLRTQDRSGVDTGWLHRGVFTLVEAAQRMTVSPDSGKGSTQRFTLTYSDPPGFAGVAFASAQFLVAAAPDGGGQPFCFVHYDRGGNGLWMYSNDVGHFLGPATPGAASNTLSSSACSVNTAAATVTNSGGSLVVSVPITMKAPMAGAKRIFQRTLDTLNRDTGWKQTGTWTVE